MPRINTIIVCILVLASLPVASSEIGLVVYKDSSGELTPQSRDNLPILLRKARAERSITVWIVFDIPYEGNPALRTPEVVADEAAAKQAVYTEHVEPLIRSNMAKPVKYNSEILDQAPGTMLHVTSAGLRKLVRSPAVRHIGHLQGDF